LVAAFAHAAQGQAAGRAPAHMNGALEGRGGRQLAIEVRPQGALIGVFARGVRHTVGPGLEDDANARTARDVCGGRIRTASILRVILDGGLATELERGGADLADPLWSARLLMDAPEAIEAVHAAYFAAGAQCVTSASYQASYEGFAARGLGELETTRLLRLSVALADRARAGRRLLVAASVGPYGAVLHDGSEYRGDYGLDVDALIDWHRPRFDVLATAGADLLACETIPTLVEARALVALLSEYSEARAWVSFTCHDGRLTAAGEPLREAAAMLDQVPQVVAIGVNCVPPHIVTECVTELRAGTTKPIVVYPNSGERWDASAHAWRGVPGARLADLAPAWVAAGASWIGGCCRTRPADIVDLVRALG
jgi:homocysteine S-methyltransferase